MTSLACSQNDLESRYAHLLQPIRDLAKNWDIDLGSQLESYMSEIEKVKISFDGGNTTMNFAEAALLIQGSACIYGRKVEYLYSLVCQVLDLVSSNKKQKEQVEGTSINDADSADVDEPLLSLDDIVEHHNITLKNETDAGVVNVVPLMPSVLVNLDDASQTSTPLVGRNGEVIGSRNDFRMNTSSIHAPSGFVLLDMAYASMIGQTTVLQTVRDSAAVDMLRSSAPFSEASDNNVVDEGCASDMSHNSDDGVLECNDDDDDAIPLATDQIVPDDPLVVEKKSLRAMKSKMTPVKSSIRNAQKDFWKLLDPHETDKSSSLKPYKSGKVVLLPEKIMKATDAVNKRKRKANAQATMEAAGKLISLIEFCNKEYFSRMDRIPTNPLKALHFAEFEDLYWIQVKKLKDQRREIFRPCQVEHADDQEDGDKLPVHEIPQLPDADEDYDDNNNDEFQIPEAVFGTSIGNNQNDPVTDVAGLHTELSDVDICGSYEELVRRHVECYMASAQQYAQDTALGRRVAEWQDRIVPRLREEEERRFFDIHGYGREMLDILDRLGAQSNAVLFSKAVEKQQTFEVCRYFLSTLQLANDRNVEISSQGVLGEAVDTMALKLLSRRQLCDNLTSYQAPSLLQPSQSQQKSSQSQKSSAKSRKRF